MMLGLFVPGELIISVDSAQIVAIAGLAVALVRMHSRVTRLEAFDEMRRREPKP